MEEKKAMRAKIENGARSYYVILGLLMLGLGCSDALRGVFAPVFREHFALDASQLSLIITVSYGGNFIFMLLGGRLSDRVGLRRAFLGALLCWTGAETVYLLTDHYLALLLGVFFAMGTSTLLNMLMNVMSPRLFAMPGAAINILFFIQAIGTTFTQGGIGRLATSFLAWKIVSLGLFLIGVVTLIAFARLSAGDASLQRESVGRGETSTETGKKDGKKTGGEIDKKIDRETGQKGKKKMEGEVLIERESFYRILLRMPAFWIFIFIFGFYFIGEHGVMNWMNIYCRDGLGMSARAAALIPSLFYGGIMLGRLLFAPLITRLKIRKTLLIFLVFGTGVYLLAFILGQQAFFLLLAAGLGLSVIYPTMTLCIQLYFHRELTTTATGAIMSAGTLFDIGFNAIFGFVLVRVGYGMGMMILPLAMCLSLGTYLVLFRWGEQVREL